MKERVVSHSSLSQFFVRDKQKQAYGSGIADGAASPHHPLYHHSGGVMFGSSLSLLLIMIMIMISALPGSMQAASYTQTAGIRVHADMKHLMRADGRPFFVLGYNYEGPYDRAWRMWEQYDAALIANDLARARAGGANTVRLFVQPPLPAEIATGNFSKLDTVVDLAARNGLYVLLTLSDYDPRDLAGLADTNRRIAEHYRGNPSILAFDLRNEPQFLTLATATYPAGPPALQRMDMIQVYGERVSRDAVPTFRASADGRILPTWWTDEQAYIYANQLALYRAFLGDAERWAVAHGGTVVDFPTSPEAVNWQPYWAAMDDTMAAWNNSQSSAIRPADPQRLLTIGWSNPLLARLPANGAMLDVMSLHRFPNASAAAGNQVLNIAAALRRAFSNRPLLLEEIGIPTSDTSPENAASIEMGMVLRAYSEGYAGFLKWMLTDLPPVGNPREDSFGALRIDGSPKPIFHTMGAFGTYLANTAAPAAGDVTFWDRADGASYSFIGRDVHYVAGLEASGPDMSFRLDAPGQVLLRKRGALYVLSTQAGSISLGLRSLMQPWNASWVQVEKRSGAGWTTIEMPRNGDSISFILQAATPYRITLPGALDSVAARANCRFFPETGHNLCGAFRSYWEQRGGLEIFGYPISDEFVELNAQEGKSYTVQYFERNRFEYHPELAGTQYEVLLGLLGNSLTEQRRDEPAFLRLVGGPAGKDFYPETGHTLGGAFREYWRANGGLAVFGYPISEEFWEYNPADGKMYVVQYFERNRFEYHPELAGTRYEVLLGLLGNQVVDGNGWR